MSNRDCSEKNENDPLKVERKPGIRPFHYPFALAFVIGADIAHISDNDIDMQG